MASHGFVLHATENKSCSSEFRQADCWSEKKPIEHLHLLFPPNGTEKKSTCYQHNCVDGIWNGSEQEKNEQDDSRRNLFLHFCMISLHFCRAGRQQIGCVKWNLYRQERQQTSPIPYDYCIFAFSCLSISFSNVTSAGKKKGKDCRKHQEEDSVSSARNMNKRIFWIGTLRRISCFLNLFLTCPNARARTAMNEEGWRCEITGKSRIGGVSQQPSRESLQCS